MTRTHDQGEFIDEWETDDEACDDCGKGPIRYRRWRRHSNGEERVFNKCWDCGSNWWIDG